MQLPYDFERYTQGLMGPERFQRLVEALGQEPSISVRLNPWKCPPKQWLCTGDDGTVRSGFWHVDGADGEVPWCELGAYLSTRPPFTFDPLLHAGAYYVQEASSMFLYYVLRQLVHRPVALLDLCAAPGGKSTAARSALPQGSLVMSNEPVALRANVLAENMMKFGHPDTMVTRNYPIDYAKAGLQFDVIVADVPCSGEGMFRKDETALSNWSPQLRDQCWHLQRSIIQDVWSCLRPGGLLIYSTCTFNALEDEENVAWIGRELGAQPVDMDVPGEWNITHSLIDDMPVYRFIPGLTRGEGFFLAILRKDGDAPDVLSGISYNKKERPKRKNGKKIKEEYDAGEANDWLKALQGDFTLRQTADLYRAVPTGWLPLYDQACKSLNVLHAGVELGTLRGRSLVPHEALALSLALKPDALPTVETDYLSALNYLRKEAVNVNEAPRGHVLLTYKGLPLGFEKNMGNRANNLYPAEWRIRSTHLPEDEVVIVKKTNG